MPHIERTPSAFHFGSYALTALLSCATSACGSGSSSTGSPTTAGAVDSTSNAGSANTTAGGASSASGGESTSTAAVGTTASGNGATLTSGSSASGGSGGMGNVSAANSVTNGTTTSVGGGTASNGAETATTGTLNPGATPVERYGQLQVVNGRLSDERGQPVMLRGQGLGWDNWWPQYYNADVVGWLSEDWCVEIVRPAMGIEPEGAYLENPSASRGRIQAVVDAAIAEDIYVIIDWHAHDLHQTEAVAFFTEMAQSYGDQPHVIYEIFNEPDEESWPEVKAYAETLIAAIRQHDPDNIVVVGTPEWDQRIDLVAEDPITTDQNVVYAVHFYAATHGDWLRERTEAAVAVGIPVIVTESSGSEADGLGGNDYTEWEAWFDFMTQNQISWLNYSVSDKEGETISVLEPGASAVGGWDTGELTESGEYIRDVLREYCY